MPQLLSMLNDAAAIDDIATYLDGLNHADRVAELRTLRGKPLGKLYDAAAGRHTGLEFFVPADTPAGQPVLHHGTNSLPAPVGGFFRKPMVRSMEDPGTLWGYNDNEGLVATIPWITGPGYFAVRDTGSESPDGRTDHGGQLFINYYERPDSAPVSGWPDPKPPIGFTAGLVFGEMCDYMWRVSEHVSIGAAFKRGKVVGAWFSLVRED